MTLQERAQGVMLGLATGDALGAGYEFETPGPAYAEMRGGGLGPWEPGEWTDDTQMALCIALAVDEHGWDLDAIADRFLAWFRSNPKDVGIQTRALLAAATSGSDLARGAAARFEQAPDHSAGNGSLMRTAPVALVHLGDDDAIVRAATDASALTHGDPVCAEACILWCIAVDRAVREERLDGVGDGLEYLAADRAVQWAAWIEQARTQPPATFRPNGWAVRAFQAALAAVEQTPSSEQHLEDALRAAVAIGGDTDTVAAIAGSLLGARWGVSAIPVEWRGQLHGWPGVRAEQLCELAIRLLERSPHGRDK